MDPFITDYIPYHLVNYGLATVFWTLIGQVALGLFIGFHSQFFVMRFFRTITGPFIRFFAVITPRFLVEIFVPLYVALWVLVLRFVFTLVMLNLGWAPRVGG